PKDAFVIKRSLSSPHLLSIALVCAGSDALLIVLGAHGLSALLSRHAAVVAAALWAGIAYLAGYGLLAFRDPFGIRPLCIGKLETEHGTEWMVASE
ncbi:LysE family transporter, partial [Bacillus licheniformis]|nr:LysE family transporter [Bacillus licheniformis]